RDVAAVGGDLGAGDGLHAEGFVDRGDGGGVEGRGEEESDNGAHGGIIERRDTYFPGAGATTVAASRGKALPPFTGSTLRNIRKALFFGGRQSASQGGKAPACHPGS